MFNSANIVDNKMTSLQANIILASNRFVHRNCSPYSGVEGAYSFGRLENRLVMTLSIGVTILMDYVKLPLATIEELVKGILLTPTIPFSVDLSKRCFSHYKHAFGYTALIPIKIFFGTLDDIDALKTSLLAPSHIPHFYLPPYCGSEMIVKQPESQNAKNNPSIYLI
jgi:hypothetical protein